LKEIYHHKSTKSNSFNKHVISASRSEANLILVINKVKFKFEKEEEEWGEGKKEKKEGGQDKGEGVVVGGSNGENHAVVAKTLSQNPEVSQGQQRGGMEPVLPD
jgi:hypothetical protein